MSWAPPFISANELAVHAAEKTEEHSAVLNFNTGENCTFIRDEKKLGGYQHSLLLNKGSYRLLKGRRERQKRQFGK